MWNPRHHFLCWAGSLTGNSTLVLFEKKCWGLGARGKDIHEWVRVRRLFDVNSRNSENTNTKKIKQNTRKCSFRRATNVMLYKRKICTQPRKMPHHSQIFARKPGLTKLLVTHAWIWKLFAVTWQYLVLNLKVITQTWLIVLFFLAVLLCVQQPGPVVSSSLNFYWLYCSG